MKKFLLYYSVLFMFLISNGLIGQNQQNKKPQSEAAAKSKSNTIKKDNGISNDQKKKKNQESSDPKTAFPSDYGVPTVTAEATESKRSEKTNPKK